MFERLKQVVTRRKTAVSPQNDGERVEIRLFRVNNDRSVHVITHTPDHGTQNQVVATGLTEREASRLLEKTGEHIADFVRQSALPHH